VFVGNVQGTTIIAGTNYYAFHLRVPTTKALESGGSCEGCSRRIAFVFDLLEFESSDSEITITGPGRRGNCVTWNSPSASLCAVTPVHRFSWGTLKQLYR
jgi:hypothetical protein